MYKKLLFWGIWIGFSVYAFRFAPPGQPDTLQLIQDLSTGNWEGINPFIVVLFNIMGIWPLIYGCLLFIDGRGQRVPAWPFAIAAFAVGAFAILPYLGLRQPQPEFQGDKNLWIKLQDSRWIGRVLLLGTLVLLIYGFQGNWDDFVHQWQTSRFIHVMSLDFCLLSLLFPALLGDDMARRNMNNTGLFWVVALIPLLGPLLYLSVRSPLPSITTSTPTVQGQSLVAEK